MIRLSAEDNIVTLSYSGDEQKSYVVCQIGKKAIVEYLS